MRSVLFIRTTARRLAREDEGLTTAEYAVGTVAVAGLGGLLLKLLTSDPVRDLLWTLISNALSAFFG
jgi:Flp pilus assembly pilin Flp